MEEGRDVVGWIERCGGVLWLLLLLWLGWWLWMLRRLSIERGVFV